MHKRQIIGASCAILIALSGPARAQETINWRGYQIDPADAPANVRNNLIVPESTVVGDDFYFVQFNGPITDAMKARAQAQGAELLTFTRPNTFISKISSADVEQVRELADVSWVGLFQPGFRLSPKLNERAANPGTIQPVTPPGKSDQLSFGDPEAAPQQTNQVAITVEMLPGEDAASVTNLIESLGGEVAAIIPSDTRGATVEAVIPDEAIDTVAGATGVEWIAEKLMPVLHNDTGSPVIGVPGVWGAPLNLQGSGQIVAVADSGLDSGVNNATMHDDVEGRIQNLFSLPVAPVNITGCGVVSNAGADDGAADTASGHGTHVAGSVLGNGTLSAGQFSGVAPQATLVMQSIAQFGNFAGTNCDGIGLLGIPNDLNDLFQQAYDQGARIHTNSWGAPVAGIYTPDSQEADQFVWDNPDMLILFSAGNEGVDADANSVVDADSIGSPGTAKNVLTVGASENNRATVGMTYSNNYGALIDADTIANNTSGMAAFSSRGPTDDGRIKPDLVAPGTLVTSMRSSAANVTYFIDEDVESGLSGWVGTGSWTQSNADSNTGTTSWTESAVGNHAQNQNITLTSPTVDLSAGTANQSLRFWTRHQMGTGDTFDVEVSNDGGASWTGSVPLTGTRATWEQFQIGLGPFAQSPNFRVRFRFQSNNDGNTGDGIWIDDISVYQGSFLTARTYEIGLTPKGSAIDQNYTVSNGTSMSTPLTAGAVALTRQYFTDILNLDYVSAALLRATLINGATDMAPGQYGGGATQEIPAGPNNTSGWGQVHVQNSIAPAAPTLRDHVDALAGLSTGETRTYELAVTDASVPISVAMVYHDFPGAGLVNNLNMTVTAPDATVFFPNGGAGADTTNNVERVQIAAANVQVGSYTISVTGQNVPQGPQPFALATLAGGTMVDRQPVDAMLVLDTSGSMNGVACTGCDPKIDVLKDSVELFAQLWSAVAVPTDRLGVAYFDSTVDEFQLAGDVLLDVDGTNLGSIVTNVLSQSAGGATAMGGGLQRAISRLTDPSRPKSVVLFTDGMQNRNPMVVNIDDSPPAGAFHLEIDNVPGRAASNVSPTTPPTVLDDALDMTVNTIGVGATPPFVEMLSDIASETDGVTKLTTAPDNDLRRFFVEELINILRNGSPQLIDYRTSNLRDDLGVERFTVNASARQVVLKLSWKRGSNMGMEISKDGVDLDPVGQFIQGPFYTIASFDLDGLARAGVSVDGDFEMKIFGKPGSRYEAAAIAEEPSLNLSASADSKTGTVGDIIKLRAHLDVERMPFRGEARVVARVLRPREAMGTLLSTLSMPEARNDIKPESGASIGQVKLDRLLLDPAFIKRISPLDERIALKETAPGVFEADYSNTLVPGTYSVEFQFTGSAKSTGTFQRTETVSTTLSIGALNPKSSGVKVEKTRGSLRGTSVRIHLRPRDGKGHFLGPDYGNRISVSLGGKPVGPVKDNGDGSYSVATVIATGTDPTLIVQALGQTLAKQPVSNFGLRKDVKPGAGDPGAAYAAKVVCGETNGEFLAKARFQTVVNIGAAGKDGAKVSYFTSGTQFDPVPGDIAGPGQVELKPNQTVAVSCEIVRKMARQDFFDGFLMVNSSEPLHVVSVHTAEGPEGSVSFHTERASSVR